MAQRICFDARMAYASGIGTYIRGLLDALPEHVSTSRMTLLARESDPLQSTATRISVSAKFYSLSEQFEIPKAFRQSGAGVLHVPHYNVPISIASRCIVTVHDLIHLKFPQFLPSRLAYAYAYAYFHYAVPRAQAILTVSENTKRDMISMLNISPHRITVTPPGVPNGFKPLNIEETEEVLGRLNLSAGYFLYVGNLKAFKNVPRLLAAYRDLKRLHPDMPPFVFVGKNFLPGFPQAALNTPDVRLISNLPRAALPGVYSGALALVFPSLYEGFGLPPLEAMACGTPVITSNRGSLPEVVGNTALLVDPMSQEEITKAMRRIATEKGLAQRMSQAGLQRSKIFRWEDTAAKTAKAYQNAP